MSRENKVKKKKEDQFLLDNKVYAVHKKIAIIVGIVLVAVLLLSGLSRILISNKMPYYQNYVYAIMPKSLETEFGDEKYTFYLEKNKDFDKEKDQPLNAFIVYYYEDNDKSKTKISLKDGDTMIAQTESSSLMVLNFLANARITDGIIKSIIKKVAIIDAVLFIPYLIYVWYITWSIKYDRDLAIIKSSKKKNQNEEKE